MREKRARDQYEFFPERFGENIRRYRQKQGITQKSLAYRAGLNRRSISALENGKHEPSASTILRLAGALDVTLEDLLSGSGEIPDRAAL